ncbi:NUDIX hydrolase [Domibacillus epiphyticus]|uniref:Coenzyme A pyrophosphatase n=1 Tax=Domibacillus epiphyticus TaxID=1714355 RepID=A0A1V2A7I6_9BACI|nr:CoA pyrophosphatase [Domibacillus epiphyticus]OMP66971.1 coenzyme A pyrophosphatase [Domibacillus epiphyticus]
MNVNELKTIFENRTPDILGSEKLVKFSLLLPLVQKQDGLHVLFEVRSLTMRRQPGEVCFPGGKIDPDDNGPDHAAVRETQEELGIQENDIHLLFPLDFMLSPFGTIIYSYVGLIDVKEMNLNEAEVDNIFTVPLDFLLNTEPSLHYVRLRPEPEENFPYHLIARGKDYNWQTKSMEEYFYFYEDKIIWGLTARILKHFLDIIRDRPDVLDK